ncbi:hypothetical protein JS533_002515 [Bifidobacterium amazonense]|uniref:Lipoprotein n=1 Tax=Bifidobacterium amazonense TaxID=2809027 RepID=A0ABS9VSU6_9BIFI|nr:hypothetical protein [Bifidobacterium amazonense]MCH9275152.1 hypothetical protein [Bifidobacterium amazonense]
MQTRQEDRLACSPLVARLVATAVTLAATLSLSSCAAPRFVGRAESEQAPSACESAYYSASDATAVSSAGSGWPAVRRYLAARSAASAWIEVAAQCTERFSEGVIRAAQSQHTAAVLGDRLGLDDGGTSETHTDDAQADDTVQSDDDAGVTSADLAPADITSTAANAAHDLTGVDDLSVDASVLSSMALAEDRAGFVVEILTARGNDDDATLALSSMHKSAGERLVSLSGVAPADDPRQKTYDVSQLVAHPDGIADPATGLAAPTLAVAEINCAREELAALSPGGVAGTSASSSASSSASGASASSSLNGEAREQTASLRLLARFVASRAARAFSYGYPAFDQALFG